MSDNDLLSAYAQGELPDANAGFAELVRRWDEQARAMLHLRFRSFNEDDRDDVMQLAYSHVHQYRDLYQPGRDARAWFNTVVTNCARDFHKGPKRKSKMCGKLSIISTETEVEATHGTCKVESLLIDHRELNPLEAMIQEENAGLLHEAIAKLPPHLQEVIELRFFQDKTQDEIKQELGINLGTVKSRIGRGLEQLRALMEESDARA